MKHYTSSAYTPTYLPAETCPTVCLAGKNGGTGALQEATLAGSGHLAVGSLQEDCFGATAQAVLPSPVIRGQY